MPDESQNEAKGESKGLDSKIEESMLDRRMVFFSSAVDDQSAARVIKKLWYLEHKDSKKPILLVINSPGGSVDSGFAIWDQIHMMKAPVVTLVMGLAASMGSVLSLVANKGKRYATPNSRIMIHQPLIPGVIQGQATDLEIHAKEILKTRESLIEIYSEKTGKGAQEIRKALDRDTWLSAKEAKEFGLIDEIVTSYETMGF